MSGNLQITPEPKAGPPTRGSLRLLGPLLLWEGAAARITAELRTKNFRSLCSTLNSKPSRFEVTTGRLGHLRGLEAPPPPVVTPKVLPEPTAASVSPPPSCCARSSPAASTTSSSPPSPGCSWRVCTSSSPSGTCASSTTSAPPASSADTSTPWATASRPSWWPPPPPRAPTATVPRSSECPPGHGVSQGGGIGAECHAFCRILPQKGRPGVWVRVFSTSPKLPRGGRGGFVFFFPLFLPI